MSMTLSSKSGVRTRKPCRCALCGELINVGELKDVRSGVNCGDMWTMHMHPECHAYEGRPGVVDEEWYEDMSDPAFTLAEAIAVQSLLQPK